MKEFLGYNSRGERVEIVDYAIEGFSRFQVHHQTQIGTIIFSGFNKNNLFNDRIEAAKFAQKILGE